MTSGSFGVYFFRHCQQERAYRICSTYLALLDALLAILQHLTQRGPGLRDQRQNLQRPACCPKSSRELCRIVDEVDIEVLLTLLESLKCSAEREVAHHVECEVVQPMCSVD